MTLKRSWRRFSLRTILLLVPVVAFTMFYWKNEVSTLQSEHAACESLERKGVRIQWRPMQPGVRFWLLSCFVSKASLQHCIGVDADNKKLDDEDLRLLTNMPFVEKLDLSRNRIGNDGLRHVRSLGRLKELVLRGSDVTDDGFVHLKNLRTLELLDVSPYSQPYMGKSPRRNASDDVLAKQKLSSGALVYLHGLPSLRQLKCLIPFNKKLADSLRAIPKLKVDSLILCDSNDDVLNELKRFPEVRSVMILDGSFGNTGLAALSELVQLERLFVV